MRRCSWPALAALLAALTLAPAPAAAQNMADMVGTPLPEANLPVGTVTVRAVRGSFADPLVGVNVTIVADDFERVARTNAEGRATIPGLEPGTQYVAQIEDGERVTRSRPFVMPARGGVRLLLSSVQWKERTVRGGKEKRRQHSPEEVSSRAQVDQSVKVGVLAVHVVRGAWDKPGAGAVVHVVGYHADGQVTRTSKVTDAEGQVEFEGLVPARAAYFGLTVLPREAGEDRLQSLPMSLSRQAGSTLVLAGREPDAEAGALDDLNRLYVDQVKPPKGPGPGEIVVRLRGKPADVKGIDEVELVEVGRPDAAAKRPTRAVTEGEGAVRSNVYPPLRSSEPAGHLAVLVVRATQDTPPLPDVSVELRGTGLDEPAAAKTNSKGLAEFPGLQPGGEYQITCVVRGQRIEAEPLVLGDEHGLVVPIGVEWGESVRFEAAFDSVPAGLDKVYLARARRGAETHHSPPFQLTQERGAIVAMPVFPSQDLRFRVAGRRDDRFMTFQGMFSVSNGSFMPYDPGPEGFVIPLPKGFAGAQVPDQLAHDLKVVRGRGLVWTGVLRPGRIEFNAAFTIPVSEGAFDFDMDLPHGALNSNVSVAYTPGMQVRVGGDLDAVLDPGRDGRGHVVVDNINLPPGQRIVMKVSGLPHQPRWRRYVRVSIGLVALALLGGALLAVVLRRPPGQADPEGTRREQLLDALADLERRKRAGTIAGARYHRTRKKLMDELGPIYAKRATGTPTDPA